MSDMFKVDRAVKYLNWYFIQDDGTADKDAVEAWNTICDRLKPVKPIWFNNKINGQLEVWCGACRESLNYSCSYCPRCGRWVNWSAT